MGMIPANMDRADCPAIDIQRQKMDTRQLRSPAGGIDAKAVFLPVEWIWPSTGRWLTPDRPKTLRCVRL